MTPTDRLRALGLSLPPVPEAKGSYAPAVIEGSRIYVSGQIVTSGGVAERPGKVGAEVDPVVAQGLARTATLQGLAAAAAATPRGLDGLRRAIRVTVFVASAEGFHRQHEVANGATELINAVFGESVRPVRAAVGVAALPLNVPVEVELLLELA